MTAPPPIDTTFPVCVTGGDGYFGGILVSKLLQEGLRVRVTVRPSSLDPRHEHPNLPRLRQIAARHVPDQAGEHLQFFAADLMKAGDFDEAVAGCRVVFHTASPFVISTDLNVAAELIDPAVHGTRHVLKAVARSGSVRRVVMTSSVGTMYADATDTHTYSSSPASARPIDEDCWNRSSTMTHQTYFLSKTMAELEAWVLAGSPPKDSSLSSSYSLVVMNPALMWGPGLCYLPTSESFRALRTLNEWKVAWAGCPDLPVPLVDVREVATAHITAALAPGSTVRGRYILCAACVTLPEIVALLRQQFPGHRWPAWTAPIPQGCLWLVVPYTGSGLDRTTVWRNYRRRLHVNADKSRRDLGLTYRPWQETVSDMAQQLIDAGVLVPSWAGRQPLREG